MFSRLSRKLGICHGEWSRLISMCILVFLLLVGWAFGRSSRDSFFIQEAGPDQLPYVYIIGSLILIITAPFYSLVVNRMARHTMMVVLLVGSAGLLIGLRLLIDLDLTVMPYLLFSMTDLIIVMLFYMHFWTFANDVFDPREGKRLFPLIGGSGLTGGIIGGLAVEPVVSAVGTVNMLVVWSGILLMAVPMVIYVNRAAFGMNSTKAPESDEENSESSFYESIASVWNVPLIRILTFMAFPLWLASSIMDYLFYAALDEMYHEQDRLTGFLGLFNSASSIFSLVVQLSITGWLLNRFGVGNSVLIHPLCLSLGTMMFTIRNLLPASGISTIGSFRGLLAVFAKLSDNVPYYSVGESSTQLLFNALPQDIRGKARSFISGWVEPIVTMLSGFILLLFIHLEMPLWVISLVTVGLALVWVGISTSVKKLYLKALVNNLSSKDVNLSGDSLVTLTSMGGAEIAPSLIEAVTSADENVALFALEQLKSNHSAELTNQIHLKLPASKPRVQVAILGIIEEACLQESTETVAQLLVSGEDTVRSAAIPVLGKLDPEGFAERIIPLLDSDNLELRAKAIVGLLQGKSSGDGYQRASAALDSTLAAEDSKTREIAVYILGELNLPQHQFRIIGYLSDEKLAVQRAAVEAAAKIADPEFVPDLIHLMRNESLVDDVTKALTGMVELSLDPLHETLRDLAKDGQYDSDPENSKFLQRILSCLGDIGDLRSSEVLSEVFGFLPEHQASRLSHFSDHSAIVDALVRIKMAQDADSVDTGQISDAASQRTARHVTGLLEQHGMRLSEKEIKINTLKNTKESKATLLLEDALRQISASHETQAMRCLQVIHQPGTIKAASSNFRRSDQRAKAEAIELLSELGREARDLARILETKYFPEAQATEDLALSGVLRKSFDSDNPLWLRVCSLYVAGEITETDVVDEVASLVKDPDLIIRRHAMLALKKLDPQERDSTLPSEVAKMGHDMERILFLKSVPLFAEMGGETIQWVNDIATEAHFSEDEVIFEEGDEGDACYLILRGSVRVVKGEDKAAVIAIREQGDYFGEMAILEDEPRSATVEAQEDTEMLVINRDDFHRLIIGHPNVLFSLFKGLSKILRETNAQLSASLERAG